jgi:hypothetical protein
VPVGKLKEKNMRKNIFCILKSMKKGAGSGVGFGTRSRSTPKKCHRSPTLLKILENIRGILNNST